MMLGPAGGVPRWANWAQIGPVCGAASEEMGDLGEDWRSENERVHGACRGTARRKDSKRGHRMDRAGRRGMVRTNGVRGRIGQTEVRQGRRRAHGSG